MSATTPINDPDFGGAVIPPVTAGPAASNPPNRLGGDEAESDARLVQETRNQIRAIVQEITELAQSDVDEEVFYAEFLNRVVSALASVGAAIWTVEEQGLQLRYQINLPRGPLHDDQESAQRHHLLLKQVLADGQPALVPPQSGSMEDAEAANPTEHLLIFAAVQFEDRPLELIEVFQRPTGGPTTQRGYLRFLVQMCELAQTFVTRRRLKRFQEREALWENLEQFIRGVHQGLDVQQTCFALVNDARRLARCDRVSVAIRHGRRYRVEAVSGLDSLDRRAEQVLRLGRLSERVSASGQSLWRRDTDEEPLAPQVEEALDAYVDVSHAKLVVVQPLYAPVEEQDTESSGSARATRREPIGALIVEQLRDSRTDAGAERRIRMIAEHGGSALANAIEHDRLFLMPLWKALGRAKWMVQARHLPKTIAALLVVAAIVAALVVVPAPLKLTCKGQLLPSSRQDVFAQTEGVVAELPVRHGQIVNPNDLLVRLRSAPLAAKKTSLQGELEEKQQQYRARNALLLRNERLDPVEQQRIEGDLRQLEKAVENLKQRLALLAIEEQGLHVYAEQRSQVATWRLQDRLGKRPVRRGEVLMTLFEPEGPWELELWMPERRMGRIEAALQDRDAPLKVSFVLSSHPNQRLEGELVERQRTADVHESEGNIVRLRVRIDKSKLPELRNEASLTAQVHCGAKPIGVVWFGDLIDTLQKTWLLWRF